MMANFVMDYNIPIKIMQNCKMLTIFCQANKTMQSHFYKDIAVSSVDNSKV